MLARILMGVAALLAVAIFAPALRAADKDADSKTHDGIVVSVADGKLTMSDKDGKNQHVHVIGSSGVKITLDGKAALLTDLAKDDFVSVTTGADGKVTAVAAKRAVKKE